MMASNDEDLRRRAERRVESVNGFRIHLAIYVLVNLLLWVIWAFSGANTTIPWPIFVTLGWGIGLLAHGWTVYGQNEDRREAQIKAEMDKLRNRP